jgi:hypothetical protein
MKMNRSSVWIPTAAVLLLAGGLGSEAAGQSILKRLEQEIRQHVAEDSAAAQADPSPSKRPPGYLGAIVDDTEDRGRGVRVLDIRPGGPADLAGLKDGDLITGVAGVRVRQTEDLADIMTVFPADSRVAFDVLREGGTEKLDVVLGQRESPADVPLPVPEAVPLPEPEADPGASPAQPAAVPPAPTIPDQADAAPAPPVANDLATEIELLHTRIAELEQRVEQLEQRLAEGPKEH